MVRRVALVIGVLSGLAIAYLLGSSLLLLVLVFVVSTRVRMQVSNRRDKSLLPGSVLAALVLSISSVGVMFALSFSWLISAALDRYARGPKGRISSLLGYANGALMVGLWIAVGFATRATFPEGAGEISLRNALHLGGVGVLWVGFAALTHATVLRLDGRKFLQRFLLHLRDGPVELVLLSAAATLAVLWPRSPAWALAIAFGSLLVTYRLLASTSRARRIEALTIRALGRLPEAAGLSPPSHAIDVARLSVAMGVLLGLNEEALFGLERAGTLHDIGLLCSERASGAYQGYSEADKASWGADIVASSTALGEEAELIRQTGVPYRAPGFDPDSAVDPRSRIIRAACAFNTLRASGFGSDEAIETLYGERFVHAPWAVELLRPALGISSDLVQGGVR